MSIRTQGHRMGSHSNRPSHSRTSTDSTRSHRSNYEPSPQQRTPLYTEEEMRTSQDEEKQQQIKERLAGDTDIESKRPVEPELEPTTLREKIQNLREKLSGDSGEKSEPREHTRTHVEREPAMTREERRAERERIREEKRKAWESSPENANNRKRREEKPEEKDTSIVDKLKEVGAELKKEVLGEPEETGEPEPKILLYGRGKKFRVDQYGIVYHPSTRQPGRWVSTGQKSKYEIPDTETDDQVESGKTRERPTPTQPSRELTRERPQEPESRGRELKPALSSGVLGRSTAGSTTGATGAKGSGFDEELEKKRLASFEKQGSPLSVGTGYLYSGKTTSAGGSGYDEELQRRRLASFEKSGSSLQVGSGYISAGGYGRGYDVEKERERLASFAKAGNPMVAGLGYAVAGNYNTGGVGLARPTEGVGKLDLKTSDVYSTGAYKFGPLKKATPVLEPEKQIDAEMAKLTQLQARQSQLTQLQQIQQMQREIQPQLALQQEQMQASMMVQQPEVKKPTSAMETMFGVKLGMSPDAVNKPASSAILGKSATYANPAQNSGSAIESLFGIKYNNNTPVKQVPKAQAVQVIGEFGGVKIKHIPHEIKAYQPKNNLPETKGGFFGLFEKATTTPNGKTAKYKKKNVKGQYLQKKVRPTASEFLFGKQK